MLNYWLYGTKRIHLLSKQQIVSRLYRSFYKRLNQCYLAENQYLQYEDYQTQLEQGRRDFNELLGLNPEEPRFKILQQKYIDYISSNYETTMLFTGDQDYSQEDGKVLYFNEEAFKVDPYGYYSQKTIFYDKKQYGEPFFEDYPINNYNFRDRSSYLVLDSNTNLGDFSSGQSN